VESKEILIVKHSTISRAPYFVSEGKGQKFVRIHTALASVENLTYVPKNQSFN